MRHDAGTIANLPALTSLRPLRDELFGRLPPNPNAHRPCAVPPATFLGAKEAQPPLIQGLCWWSYLRTAVRKSARRRLHPPAKKETPCGPGVRGAFSCLAILEAVDVLRRQTADICCARVEGPVCAVPAQMPRLRDPAYFLAVAFAGTLECPLCHLLPFDRAPQNANALARRPRKPHTGPIPRLTYPCRHTSTADTSRMATSTGIRMASGTIPSSWPPIATPITEPSAISPATS